MIRFTQPLNYIHNLRSILNFQEKKMFSTLNKIGKESLEIWIQTLKTQNPKKMASLYSKDAVLLPTLDSSLRDTNKKIEDYFKTFLAKGPSCEIQEIQDFQLCDTAVTVVGHYGFKFNDKSSADARFTYILTKDNESNKWLIKHHHSSLQP